MCGKKNCHSSRRIISHPPAPPQWRIRDFPDVNPPNLGQNSIIWQDFCGKLHENERIWTERQSHVLSVPPPIGSANVHPPNYLMWVCISYIYWKFLGFKQNPVHFL